MSLRARLLITSVALVALGLVASNAATYRYLSRFLLHRVDEQLVAAERAAGAALSIGEGPGGGHGVPGAFLPSGTYAAYVTGGGRVADSVILVRFPGQAYSRPVLPSSLPGSATSRTTAPRTFSARSIDPGFSTYRVLAAGIGPGQGTLVVAIPLAEVTATLHRLVVVAIVVSAVVLLLVAGLALWLVRVGLRPLQGIGDTAGAIAAGDLSRRVEPADERTEVGRLGLALNSMLTQIEAAFDERRASEDRLRRFVADASHELRTPLTSIRGYAELFRRGADARPRDLARSMGAIEAEARRMGVLVDDLLLLARLDQGRPLEREPVDLAAVAGAAVESARTIAPDRPVELLVEGSSTVPGDEGRLRQVIDNLLDNARVHTPAGTPVRVRLRTEDGRVVLVVEDEGPGLPPEVEARAFERFYRGDPTRSRDTGGAGLGLSIATAIVEAHGGGITASTREGPGARFEVRLPAIESP